jgi:hypothetical protein
MRDDLQQAAGPQISMVPSVRSWLN